MVSVNLVRCLVLNANLACPEHTEGMGVAGEPFTSALIGAEAAVGGRES